MKLHSLSPVVVVMLALTAAQGIMAQEITTRLEKREYRIDETLLVFFRTAMIPDSTAPFDTSAFHIVSGPNRSSSSSYVNNVGTTSYELSYQLWPKRPGVLQLNVPVFYKDGATYSGRPSEVVVTGTAMSAKERHNMDLKLFRIKGVKPTRSQRVVFHKDLAYLEEFDGSIWVQQQELSMVKARKLSKLLGK